MDSDSYSDHSSESEENNGEWLKKLQKIKENDPNTTWLRARNDDDDDMIEDMTDEDWKELGRDIANNTHLSNVDLGGNINDQIIISCLFQGLTRSSSMKEMQLYKNRLSVAGVRSMVPFLQNADNLTRLDLEDNNIRSEGFNDLFRALHSSPIETLLVRRCNIESIEIDSEHTPQNLSFLAFDGNNINSDGCIEIAKLLQGRNDTLQLLSLEDNEIDDEGVEILVDALKNNASLTHIYLRRNDGISVEGVKLCLRLVNDVSSINATLQSNHTLRYISVNTMGISSGRRIQSQIHDAVQINRNFQDDLNRVGREKIIQTQLKSKRRKELEDMQGVRSSLYSEIDPLHLPEVLALVGRRHGQGELFVALKSSVAGVISTVNRRECLKHKRAHHEAMIAEYMDMIAHHRTQVEEVEAEIAAIDEADGPNIGNEYRSSKRRRG